MNEQLNRLPLHEQHAARGARFGAFGDWEVPLYYTSILEEHQQVRTKAGLFDISHMGEFLITGKDAEIWLNSILPRDIKKLSLGHAWYAPLLNDYGGFVDDIIVYKVSAERFWMIVNAGNVSKDFNWLQSHLKGQVNFENLSESKGLLAIQGPLAKRVVIKIFPSLALENLPTYSFVEIPGGLIARTGYTGEDGFEIMVEKSQLNEIWKKCFEDPDLLPIGFGARDTLRLEAGMLLYGHDMNDDTNPLEAGIEWTLDFTKPSFMSRENLLTIQKRGVSRKLVGFEMLDRGIPRQGFLISQSGKVIGEVTSGSFSPTFQKNIGMGYVSRAYANPEEEIDIIIREKSVKAKILKLPFYRRKKSR